MTRLDLALVRLHPELSRRKAREVIEKGQVSVGGQTLLAAGAPVAPDAEIRWDPNRKARSRVRLSLPLLYADERILIVDKPAGLLSVPRHEGSHEDSVLERVREYVRRVRPRRPYVGAVHRLDRETSGALAVALDPAARAAMRALFRDHRIERTYVALAVGTPRADQGVVDEPIRDAYRGGRRGVARPGEKAREAVTRWRVRERLGAVSRLEVDLATGRQHQIRAHLAHVGLPILGDGVYGRGTPAGIPASRQMLHAARLGFVHPLTQARVAVESPLPDDFRRLLARLRRQAGSHLG